MKEERECTWWLSRKSMPEICLALGPGTFTTIFLASSHPTKRQFSQSVRAQERRKQANLNIEEWRPTENQSGQFCLFFFFFSDSKEKKEKKISRK
jgi:hypothetical protein